ncbi:MAG TPA: type II secretion system minor pseudopilin GspK [Novosphingobium sp.]|nr:type II secretion system minor pseudopilin GspK [Novosphingobium sp.]
MRPPDQERGAALLSVLLLVAVMAVIAAVMLERLNLATRLAANSQAMAQARLHAVSTESLAMARIKALVALNPQRTVDPRGLLGREFALPLASGAATVRIDDAGNCFNVNSLVEGQEGNRVLRPAGLAQLRSLMTGLEIPEAETIPLTDAIADWLDSDDLALPNGAEDAFYQGLATPYRTAGRLIVDPSELRAIKGMTPAYYARLRPWLCALPAAELSPLNVNTLRPDQARLIAMLAPTTIDVRRAQSIIAQRPAGGIASAADFLRPFAAGGQTLGPEPIGQLQVTSRWFRVDLKVAVDSIRLDEEALVDIGLDPPRVVSRSWGDAETR